MEMHQKQMDPKLKQLWSQELMHVAHIWLFRPGKDQQGTQRTKRLIGHQSETLQQQLMQFYEQRQHLTNTRIDPFKATLSRTGRFQVEAITVTGID